MEKERPRLQWNEILSMGYQKNADGAKGSKREGRE